MEENQDFGEEWVNCLLSGWCYRLFLSSHRTIEDMLRRNELVFWFGQQQVGASERKGERREKGIGSGLSFPKLGRVFPFTCSESFECLDTPSLVSSSVNSKRRTRVSATEIGPLFSTSCTVTFLVSLLFYSARLGPGPKSAYSFHLDTVANDFYSFLFPFYLPWRWTSEHEATTFFIIFSFGFCCWLETITFFEKPGPRSQRVG